MVVILHPDHDPKEATNFWHSFSPNWLDHILLKEMFTIFCTSNNRLVHLEYSISFLVVNRCQCQRNNWSHVGLPYSDNPYRHLFAIELGSGFGSQDGWFGLVQLQRQGLHHDIVAVGLDGLG